MISSGGVKKKRMRRDSGVGLLRRRLANCAYTHIQWEGVKLSIVEVPAIRTFFKYICRRARQMMTELGQKLEKS